MKKKEFRIRTMNSGEINLAVKWAADEGWNPGLNDAECYLAADPNGFLVGLLDDEPIASISVINYNNSFGFIGFYIVKPEYRGKGYGIKIWNEGLKYLKGLNIGLDGVLDQQENYMKSGFNFAYSNIRYEGFGGGVSIDNVEFVKLSNLDFNKIQLYEKDFFPSERNEFLRSWINQPNSDSLGILEEDKLVGYGVIRECLEGYKIGPLYADNSILAEILFKELKSKTTNEDKIFLDVPETNLEAVKMAEKNKMKSVFETARMYTGEEPDLPLERIFGVTSFEIG